MIETKTDSICQFGVTALVRAEPYSSTPQGHAEGMRNSMRAGGGSGHRKHQRVNTKTKHSSNLGTYTQIHIQRWSECPDWYWSIRRPGHGSGTVSGASGKPENNKNGTRRRLGGACGSRRCLAD